MSRGFSPQIASKVVKLNTNENPYPPSPAVLKAISEIKPEQLRRYPDPMGNVFREAAAKINGVEPDWIMVLQRRRRIVENGVYGVLRQKEAGGVSCADLFALPGAGANPELQDNRGAV